jgi:hypothetical protein
MNPDNAALERMHAAEEGDDSQRDIDNQDQDQEHAA